jgi:hypothetical protein
MFRRRFPDTKSSRVSHKDQKIQFSVAIEVAGGQTAARPTIVKTLGWLECTVALSEENADTTWLATPRSALPSPLKSPTTMRPAPGGTEYTLAGVNSRVAPTAGRHSVDNNWIATNHSWCLNMASTPFSVAGEALDVQYVRLATVNDTKTWS